MPLTIDWSAGRSDQVARPSRAGRPLCGVRFLRSLGQKFAGWIANFLSRPAAPASAAQAAADFGSMDAPFRARLTLTTRRCPSRRRAGPLGLPGDRYAGQIGCLCGGPTAASGIVARRHGNRLTSGRVGQRSSVIRSRGKMVSRITCPCVRRQANHSLIPSRPWKPCGRRWKIQHSLKVGQNLKYDMIVLRCSRSEIGRPRLRHDGGELFVGCWRAATTTWTSWPLRLSEPARRPRSPS